MDEGGPICEKKDEAALTMAEMLIHVATPTLSMCTAGLCRAHQVGVTIP